ncbi:MAG TPA: C40 family peptidase [Mycobacteriales bacterium]|nr:C40 family peptidase [Mycobacteriales bacterium]
MTPSAPLALPHALKPSIRLRRIVTGGLLAGAVTLSAVPSAQAAVTHSSTTASPATTASASSTSSTTTTTRMSRAQVFAERADKVLHVAANQKGDPYRWGATGPNAFDCSGLVLYTFRKALGRHLPRTAEAQKQGSHRIWHRRNLRPGDLVFATNRSGYAYHVGIYAGHGYMWDAPHSGSHVKKQKMWHARWRFGRYINN